MSVEVPELAGARIQRVDGPRRSVVVLTLRRADRATGSLILSLDARAAGWGWVESRPRGLPASSAVQRLRRWVENARVERVEVRDAALLLTAVRGARRGTLTLALEPPAVNFAGEGDEPVTVLEGTGPSRRNERREPETFEAMARVGPRLWTQIADAELEADRRAWLRGLGRRRKSLRRREAAIEGDLARIDEVAGMRERASLLLAHLSTIPDDASDARLMGWDGSPVAISIDPRLGAKGQAEALFKRARRVERGGEIAIARLEATAAEVQAIETAEVAVREAAERAALDRAIAAARKLGAGPAAPPGRRVQAKRKPYRRFAGTGDRTILVGRSAAENDRLTLDVARPHDRWLHVRGMPGSHVVVPLDKREDCPPELLLDAAELAAHFSRAAADDTAEVIHTDRRYVRKPRGAPAGSVRVDREKVLLLRRDAERLRNLLARERHEDAERS